MDLKPTAIHFGPNHALMWFIVLGWSGFTRHPHILKRKSIQFQNKKKEIDLNIEFEFEKHCSVLYISDIVYSMLQLYKALK